MTPVSYRTALLVIAVFLSSARAQPEDLEALSRSDQWQVRYCVPLEFRSATPHARTTLERLARDPNVRVARQAFAVYTTLFVDVDFEITKAAFARGDFDQDGINVADPLVFRSAAHWRAKLQDTFDDAQKATAVRALGLLGDTSVVPELSHTTGKNPYLLVQLAVASRRLGADDQYLKLIATVLDLPAREAAYYQTFCVDCLLQTHPERARAAWEKIEASIQSTPDLQPNWVYSHAVRRTRLP